MNDLRCSHRLHAKFFDDIFEVHCRRCSGLASTDKVDVRVFHQWRRVDHDKLEELPDREERSKAKGSS